MIEQEVMDQIIQVPTEDEAMEEQIQELRDRGFIVTNFSKGGIFYTLLRIAIHIGIQIKETAVDLINSAFMAHCPDEYVEIRAADFSKTRKEGTKTEGYVTVYRSDATRAAKIAKGHPFRTDADAYGNYLRYYAKEEQTIPEGTATQKILVQAEEAGEVYNVAAGRINNTMVHIEGYSRVTNEEGWMTEEGSSQESLDSLRSRCLNSRAENAVRNIDAKIKSVAENVPGVRVAYVDSQHPRGQGTWDVIVTGASGEASKQLLQQVADAISPMLGSYGDMLVKSSVPQKVDISVDIFIEKGVSTSGYQEQAEALIRDMMAVANRAELNTLYLDAIRAALSNGLDRYRKCRINSPEDDIEEGTDVAIVLGDLTVTVQNIT